MFGSSNCVYLVRCGGNCASQVRRWDRHFKADGNTHLFSGSLVRSALRESGLCGKRCCKAGLWGGVGPAEILTLCVQIFCRAIFKGFLWVLCLLRSLPSYRTPPALLRFIICVISATPRRSVVTCVLSRGLHQLILLSVLLYLQSPVRPDAVLVWLLHCRPSLYAVTCVGVLDQFYKCRSSLPCLCSSSI